jgi:hypothetical protein
MEPLSLEYLKVRVIPTLFKQKGYLFRDKPYEMNIVAVRNDDKEANTFNDFIALMYIDNQGILNVKVWPCTTDAGLYYRLNPANIEGTAIIVPGQYLKVYKIGQHKGYKAMEQIAPIKYIRDNNRDKVLNWIFGLVGLKYKTEIAKTNIHHAGIDSIQVDKWSAGCIVFKKIADFNSFMAIIEESVNIYHNDDLFDLTLFEQKDFV